MKFPAIITLMFSLLSLPTWGDTDLSISNSHDYVITGRVVEGTCTLSIPEMSENTDLFLGTIAFGSESVLFSLSASDADIMNTVPPIGESLISKDMKLIVQCPASMAGTTITVKLSTPNEVDAGTKAIKNQSSDQGDFGIKIHDKDNNQDIDFTEASASSLKLTPSTTDAYNAQAEVNYQASLVRYGDKVTDAQLFVNVIFNVAYE